MPWCGYWGEPFGGFWWLMPLFGLLFMGIMAFLCLRGLGRWRRPSCGSDGELADLHREVASLREELRRLRHAG